MNLKNHTITILLVTLTLLVSGCFNGKNGHGNAKKLVDNHVKTYHIMACDITCFQKMFCAQFNQMYDDQNSFETAVDANTPPLAEDCTWEQRK